MLRRFLIFIFVLGAVAWSPRMPVSSVDAQRADEIPQFAVDTAWPKPLPNKWAVGPVSGIATDARDHIWIIHRGEVVKQAGGVPAPPVIEFDPAGNIVQTWGGPGAGYEWPQLVHGITIDARDRVWISGNGEKDAHILAFRPTGKFLGRLARPGKSGGSHDTANVARATQTRVDVRQRSLRVGRRTGPKSSRHRVRLGNRRYKRHWGAYGERPDDAAATAPCRFGGPPPRQFGSAVHCVRFDRDGFVYVCDRSNSRFQIFRKDGGFVKEMFVSKAPPGAGTVYDLDFSPDQKFIYVADGANQKVWILRRDQMQIVGSFGERGSGSGQFATSLHDFTVDSRETSTRAKRRLEDVCRSSRSGG